MSSRQSRTELAQIAGQQVQHPLLVAFKQYLQEERDKQLGKLASADTDKEVRQLQGRVQQLDDIASVLWPKATGQLTTKSNQST